VKQLFVGMIMSVESRLSIRVDTEELENLKNFAHKQNKTFSDWVRETLLTSAGMSSDKYVDLEKRLERLEQKFLDLA
jgi:predicted DNA-binding protein